MRTVVTGQTADATAWMRSRAAKVKPFDLCSIRRTLWMRPHAEQLIEIEFTMVDIATCQSVNPFEIGWTQGTISNQYFAHIGRVPGQGIDNVFGRLLAAFVPGPAD